MEIIPARKRTPNETKMLEDFILDKIASNFSKREILELIKREYQCSRTYASRKYAKVMNQIYEETSSEKIEHIRFKKITALEKDIKEAYRNYENAIDPDVKIKWFALYSKLKTDLNAFYPNALQQEEAEKSNDIVVKIEAWTVKE